MIWKQLQLEVFSQFEKVEISFSHFWREMCFFP